MPTEEKKVNIEFSPSELFQLHLSVVCRSADATIKWANACSQEEQEHAQKQIAYLTNLAVKLENELKKSKE